MKKFIKYLMAMCLFWSFQSMAQVTLVASGTGGPTAWRNFNLPTPIPGPPTGTPYGNYTGQPAGWQTSNASGAGWQATVINDTWSPAGQPQPMWVAEPAGQVYGVLFRTNFNLTSTNGVYYMTLRPDNQCEVFINGVQIGGIYNWSNGLVTVCVPNSVLQVGTNRVGIQTTEWANAASRQQFLLERENAPVGPSITPGDEKYCSDDAPVQYTGTPTGGTWSGNGISSSGLFTPSSSNIGSNTLTYTVTSAVGPCTVTSSASVIAIVEECCPDDMASFTQVKFTFVNTSTPSGLPSPIDSCCTFGFSSVTWTVCELFQSGPFNYVSCYQVNTYNLQYTPSPGAIAYEICLTVVDCAGCEDKICGEWTELKKLTDGGKSSEGNEIGFDIERSDIKILPNPNNGSFQISISGYEDGLNSEMFITDLSGKVMMKISEPSSRVLITNLDLSAGMYVFVHKNDEGTQTEKILVQK